MSVADESTDKWHVGHYHKQNVIGQVNSSVPSKILSMVGLHVVCYNSNMLSTAWSTHLHHHSTYSELQQFH